MEKMVSNICLFFLVHVFFFTITHAMPHYRYRRQIYSNVNENLPYGGWGGGSNNPSGAIPGAYYGSGIDPNYGNIRPDLNSAHNDAFNVVNYNQGSLNNGGYNLNLNQQQQSSLNNNNNAWQQQPNSNYYNNRPYNRYPPGSQGWYATGGNYWYNKGRSLMPHVWLLVIGILMLIIYI